MPIVARIVVIVVFAILVAGPAWAYVGPGAGLSLLGAFWALLTAVFAALGFLVLWPLRRFLRRVRTGAASPRHSPEGNASPTPEAGAE